MRAKQSKTVHDEKRTGFFQGLKEKQSAETKKRDRVIYFTIV